MVERLGAPHWRFTDGELALIRSPLVYVWTRGGEVLYVGQTHQGLVRPLAASHERLRAFQPGDNLLAWRTADPNALENAVLYHLRPPLNRTKPVSCPICDSYLGAAQTCDQPGHAPDPSFFVPTVRINAERRPGHDLRLLRGSLYPETPTGTVLPSDVSPRSLEQPTPGDPGDHRDDVAARGGTSPGPPATAHAPATATHGNSVTERWRQDRRDRDARVRLLLNEALTLLEPEKEPSP